MQDQLIPIDQIVQIAQQQGVTFGHGSPKIHLAYLTKLRLLPQTVRRKIGRNIKGCYPTSVIATLQKIEQMKNSGLTYSQIKYQLSNFVQTNSHSSSHPEIGRLVSAEPNLSIITSGSGLAFLAVGLLLGYLLTNANPPSSAGSVAIRSQLVPSKAEGSVESTNLVKNQNQQEIYQLTTIRESASEATEPIYLIAMPKQNLDRLGKMDINSLIRN